MSDLPLVFSEVTTISRIILENTEVYNIVCDSLGLEPKPNNGTLRLPLKPIGLHSDKPTSTDDSAPDFPAEGSEPNPTASSVETNVSNDKASANDTTPVDTMGTEGPNDTVSSEGIICMKHAMVSSSLTAHRRRTIRRGQGSTEQFLGPGQSEDEGRSTVGERGHCELESKPQ